MADLDRGIAKLGITSENEAPEIAVDAFAKTIRSNHRARDITRDFQKAAQALRTGQIVKNDSFTLFESVQALEIMDPKMDSGFLKSGESLHHDFDLSSTLSLEQVLGIMDDFLRYELAWHQGYPLSQSLFTSVHLDHILTQARSPGDLPTFPASPNDTSGNDKLLHLVLRAYCVAVIKCCDISVEMIASQLYFEEEDFCTQTYGRDLLTDVTDNDAILLVDQAVSWLKEQETEPEREQVLRGLADRLEYRKSFIIAFLPAENKPLPVQLFESCLKLLETIRVTHSLAIEVPGAFSAKMHRKLASTAPPRQPIELAFQETCNGFEHMFKDLKRTLDVVGFDANGGSLKSFLWSFALREPQPCTFARAFLQSLTVGQVAVAGPEGVAELIWTDLETSVPPVIGQGMDRQFWDIEHPGDGRFKAARIVDFFLERASPEYMKLFQSLCQNKCRIRRCLANVLSDFDNLLSDVRASAKQAENEDGAAPRSEVIRSTRAGLDICLQLQMRQIMQWVVQLGFEQDLFQTHELGLGHWMVRRFSSEITAAMADLLLVKGGQDRTALLRRIRLEAKLAVERIGTNLADGVSVIYHALQRLGVMPKDHHLPFTTPQMQYELRVQPFIGLSCYAFPNYTDFRTWIDDTQEPLPELLQSAALEIEEARKLIHEVKRDIDPLLLDNSRCETEWGERLQKTEKVCVRAKLLLLSLQQGVTKHGERGLCDRLQVTIPTLGKRDSEWWIVPEIRIE